MNELTHPQPILLPLSEIRLLYRKPECKPAIKKILREYGLLLATVPGVIYAEVCAHTLKEQLENDIYGLLMVMPKTFKVIATFHFQAVQYNFDHVTLEPQLVVVDQCEVSMSEVQARLVRRMYDFLRDHLLSRWWYGLSPNGYPTAEVVFRPDYITNEYGGLEERVPGSIHRAPNCKQWPWGLDGLIARDVPHPKEAELPRRMSW